MTDRVKINDTIYAIGCTGIIRQEKVLFIGEDRFISIDAKDNQMTQFYSALNQFWCFTLEQAKEVIKKKYGNGTFIQTDENTWQHYVCRIKLRDMDKGHYKQWLDKNCKWDFDTPKHCWECIFRNVFCAMKDSRCWIHHKDMFSDKFLDQEIDLERPKEIKK